MAEWGGAKEREGVRMTVERGHGGATRAASVTAGPSRLAELLRPELAGLAAEIVEEIRANVPAYADPLAGPTGAAIRTGIQHAVTLFLDQLVDPDTPRQHGNRRLTRTATRTGPDLDSLRTAYRVGVRVAWRRVVRAGRRGGLSPAILSYLAEVMLAFVDELASIALDGYREAKSSTAGAVENWRRRLLYLILERPAAPAAAITELAGLAGWPVPREVSVVALHLQSTVDRQPMLDADILAAVSGNEPCLLVPGVVGAERVVALRAALPSSARLAVGPPVPLAGAADSLRWARRALLLVQEGVLPAQQVVWVADVLSTLVLHADAGLLGLLGQRLFAPLEPLTTKQRARMLETLRAWLEAQGNVLDVAAKLRVHPQTVRYRMRQLHAMFGDGLSDPRTRFEMELILRTTPAPGRRSVDGLRDLVPRSPRHAVGTR
jgi:PucR-like helix-turn-helix protein